MLQVVKHLWQNAKKLRYMKWNSDSNLLVLIHTLGAGDGVGVGLFGSSFTTNGVGFL